MTTSPTQEAGQGDDGATDKYIHVTQVSAILKLYSRIHFETKFTKMG